ncbi:unnamed protein product, partial [Rotaria socialis]
MHQQPTRSARTPQRRAPLNSSSGDLSDSSSVRATVPSSHQPSEYQSPLHIIPSSSTTLMTTSQPTLQAQTTTQENFLSQPYHSKTVPSF